MALYEDAPVLEGWITLTDAAELLGISKQAVHKMVTSHKITTLHKIGRKPLYIMREAEITRLRELRRAS